MRKGWTRTSLRSSSSLRTLGYKGRQGLSGALLRAAPHIRQEGRPGPGLWDGTGHRQCVSCLGTTNPLASRGWVAWQLLPGALGRAGPARDLSGGPGSWEPALAHTPSTGWRPVHEDRKELGDTHWGQLGRLQSLRALCSQALWSQGGREHTGHFVSGPKRQQDLNPELSERARWVGQAPQRSLLLPGAGLRGAFGPGESTGRRASRGGAEGGMGKGQMTAEGLPAPPAHPGPSHLLFGPHLLLPALLVRKGPNRSPAPVGSQETGWLERNP